MVGIQPTTPFGDVVAGVAVVHSAFAVEVVTAVAEGRVERCYNITIRQFTCCVNAHLLLLECVENSNLQFKMFSLAFFPFSAMSFVKKAATLLLCSRRNFVHAFHDPYCLINHHNHVKIIDVHISNTNPKRQFGFQKV